MLYRILANREAVNALKQLEDGTLSDTRSLNISPKTAHVLAEASLVHYEEASGQLQISGKGTQFIKLVDELKQLTEGDESRIKLSFNLSQQEEDVLLLLAREGGEAEERALADLCKAKDAAAKKEVPRMLENLASLTLCERVQGSVRLTALGKRMLRDRLLDSFNLQ